MQLFGIEVWALVGFLVAAYAIVANDSIQTLGTFLSSNARRPWWVLWLFACAIILGVMAFGWFTHDGDIAFDRLDKIPYPEGGVQWWHAVPPLALLVLTQFGIPVSTTFLVLTIFAMTGGAATEGVLASMLIKSGVGYLVAFVAGAYIWMVVSSSFERWVGGSGDQPVRAHWFVLQWISTAYLWSVWLMQDLANIFVFLPRETSIAEDGSITTSFDPALILFATVIMLGLHAFIFARRGGEIQKIVTTKTNVRDVRAATLVDFTFGTILFVFKEISDIPMSTTWVFLGLLAGRELAITMMNRSREPGEASHDVITDAVRAGLGLVVSVGLAVGLPAAARGELDETFAAFVSWVGF